MLLFVGAVVIGLGLLAWASDRFISGAAATARALGVAPILIGLTVVSFGTSAPEILVAVIAAANGIPDLAIGNVVGSNIANIGLVLGAAVAIRRLTMTSMTLRRELPVMLAATFLPLLLYIDGQLGRLDAAILLVSLGLLLYWLFLQNASAKTGGPLDAEFAVEIPPDMSLPTAAVSLVIGLITLLVGAELVVFGAEEFARTLGVSEVVIGVTVVAVGTSLPELAVAVTGARRNQPDLVIGNVIGSNIFNLLGVVGITGMIAPHEFEAEILMLHYPAMAAITLAVFVLTYNPRKHRGELGRMSGITLLLLFCAYQCAVAWLAVSV